MQQLGKTPGPASIVGTNEHAIRITEGRHPGVQGALLWLTFAHLPESLRPYSRPFYEAAVEVLAAIGLDSPELTTALNKLIEAKDSAVRAGIRHQTGRAGSIPRPQEVVSPPPVSRETTSEAPIGSI